MARLIGMDEAGLGPNLGPFVVAATVWDVPVRPHEFDFWQTFASVLTNSPDSKDARLHIADSKQVFQPQRDRSKLHRSLEGLERGVLSALGLIGQKPESFTDLRQLLQPSITLSPDTEQPTPWYRDGDLELPLGAHDLAITDRWRRCCEENGVRLVTIKAAVIEPRLFNQLVDKSDNKSWALSRVAFQLLRSVWEPDEFETFVVADKHGGRNRYDQLLSEVLEQQMIFRLKESAERSDYRVGKTLLRFQPRAEEFGPVALASMTAKYLRELAMALFNRFWMKHVDGLKPTQGYPVDAKRFREQIAAAQKRLEIADEDLWRNR